MKLSWRQWWVVDDVLVKLGTAPTTFLEWLERTNVVTFDDGGVTVIPRR